MRGHTIPSAALPPAPGGRYRFVTKMQEVCSFVILKLLWVTGMTDVVVAELASTARVVIGDHVLAGVGTSEVRPGARQF